MRTFGAYQGYGFCVKLRCSPDKLRSNVIREQQSLTTSPDDARAALIRATVYLGINANVALISRVATRQGAAFANSGP